MASQGLPPSSLPYAFILPQTIHPVFNTQPIALSGGRDSSFIPDSVGNPGVMPRRAIFQQNPESGKPQTEQCGYQEVIPSNLGLIPNKGKAILAKDADGKFPDPHCTNTYLGSKRLKSHLLRHKLVPERHAYNALDLPSYYPKLTILNTGDRPYWCILCNNSFSRSDILNAHFTSCELQRGNYWSNSPLASRGSHQEEPQACVG